MIATLRRWWIALCVWFEQEGRSAVCRRCDGLGVIWTPRAGHELCPRCRGRERVRP